MTNVLATLTKFSYFVYMIDPYLAA